MLMLLAVAWFAGTMIDFMEVPVWITTSLLMVQCLLCILENLLMLMSTSDNYSMYYFLQKLGLVTRVLIPNKYQQLRNMVIMMRIETVVDTF